MHQSKVFALVLSCLATFAVADTTKNKDRSMMQQEVGHVYQAVDGLSIAPSQRLHLILLGVANVADATQFFESLGWTKSPTGHAGFAKFDLGGYALCLLPKKDLAVDALAEPVDDSAPKQSDFSGVAFVYLTKTPEEVPAILAKAVESGGTLVKPATRTPWGIAGYFKDPNGYLFEVDYEDPWVFDSEHRLVVDKLN